MADSSIHIKGYDPPLDPKITRFVEILNKHGIETYESCQGGEGHSYTEPAVRFHGDRSQGFKALDVAMKHAMPVKDLRRFWSVYEGEPIGPKWELVFCKHQIDAWNASWNGGLSDETVA